MKAGAFAIAAALCALASAAPAAAQTAYAVGQGSPNQITLSIPVTASVGGRCGFATAPSGSHNEPDFDTHSWSRQFAFVLDCNGPSRVGVVSSNGGLLTPGAAPSGYATKAHYQVTLNLVPTSGSPVTGSCAAADLVAAGGCTFRGPASTAQGLRLGSSSVSVNGSYIQVSAPAYAGADTLVNGTYSDTLTITLSASP
jgi:hypothetical protein